MAQASSSWQQVIDQIFNGKLPEFKLRATKNIALKRFQEPGGVLGFLTIAIAMLLWNWKLLLASSVGVGIMILTYSIQGWNWQLRWSEIRKFLNSPSHRLAIAVSSGGIACVSTYMAAAIWFDAKSPWIATGLIVQGLGTLLTLILVLWQIVNFYGFQEENQLDRLVENLTEKDPLKRLVAVRQITKLFTRKRVDFCEQQNITECLQLLLRQEEEPAIREAIFQSLQALEQLQILSPTTTAIKIPTHTKSKSRVSC
ncbi:armadillo-type fold-containing protein [Chlorogloeopsis sp. ULAP02]|uniref:armadillo-type fold-containing protein n=1 Tax=Chlorogloeopsis sp. ULAP02 TaxID=3107926 RepID=UPI003136CBC1